MEISSMKELPLCERPREKALLYGIETLSDSELLAILLGSGSKGKNVLQLASSVFYHFGSLRRLAQTTIGELKALDGIGDARAMEIKACFEIARRFQQASLVPGEPLESSRKVFEHFHEMLRDEKKEKFFCILLDTKHRIIKKELISVGSLNISIVHPREVFACAIRESANSILLLHNHPSGDPYPSQEDIYITKRLIKVGKVVGIEIIDHIIIGNGCYVSFLEQRLLET